MYSRRTLDRWLVVITAIAAAKLTEGILRLYVGDLDKVVGWIRQWVAGVDPYRGPDSRVDYPPEALLILAPLSLLSGRGLHVVWVGVNLGCKRSIDSVLK